MSILGDSRLILGRADRLGLHNGRGNHGWLRLWLRRLRFPIAIFTSAGAVCAQLGTFFYHERRAALRARLRNRLVRRSKVAIGVAAAAVEDPACGPASFGGAAANATRPSLHLGHLMPSVIGRVYLHFGYFSQPMKSPKRPARRNNSPPQVGAFFAKRHIGRLGFLGAGHQAARSLAIWISGAGKEGAEAAALDDHFLAAVVAILGCAGLFVGHFAASIGEVARKVAIRICG